jgi:hypothetical protein
LRTLFLSWQDPNSRSWFPIGQLTHRQGVYHFCRLTAPWSKDFAPFTGPAYQPLVATETPTLEVSQKLSQN